MTRPCPARAAAVQHRPLSPSVCAGLNGARIAFVGGSVWFAVDDPENPGERGQRTGFPTLYFATPADAFAAHRAALAGLAEAHRIMRGAR